MVAQAIFLPFFWLLTATFIAAVGYALAPFKKQSGTLSASIFTWFWYGLGISIAFLQVWNLFLPIGLFSWLCIMPVALYGGFKLYTSGTIKGIKIPSYFFLICFLPILVFLVLSSLDNTFIYDTLVYHFYTIKWFNNLPVTPGMGNLFVYLGLNQSYFLLPAFLNGLWPGYKGACATNGLLAMLVCAEILFTTTPYILKKAKLPLSVIFKLLFLPLCINIGVQNLSSPTPDVFINLLTFKVLADLIACLETKQSGFQDLYLLAFYSVMGLVIKLSFIGVAMGMLVIIVVVITQNKLWKTGPILKSTGLLLILFVPWAIRGIISSGYIGFPLSILSVPADWKMPQTVLKNLSDYITGFARTQQHGQGAMDAVHSYKWLPAWIKRMLSTTGFVLPVILLFGSTLVLKIRQVQVGKLYFLLTPVLISLPIWFFTAPDIRFVVFSFWAIGIMPLAYLINSGLKISWVKPFAIVVFACCMVVIVRNRNTDLKPMGDLPKTDMTVFTTQSGFKVNIIKNIPPNDNWQIGDCAIPCAVFPDANLAMRGKTLKEGFKVK